MRYVFVPLVICMLIAVGYIFSPPLKTLPPAELQRYAASQFLSEPAQAGQEAFTDRCSSCHGFDGSGTDTAPSLLDRAYAADFRDVDAFHRSVARNIPAHDALLGASRGDGELDFNKLEFLAKYLREMRDFRDKKAREES